VIAVSTYVRDFRVDTWGMDPFRVGRVEHGVDPPVLSPGALRPGTLPEFDGPFLFTAGSLRPARGLEDAIRALPVLRARGLRATLVVAGSAATSRDYEQRMRRLAGDCGVMDLVVWAGDLSAGEMSWCYQNCCGLVMTSRAEACPNVLLEAMAHACLCVSVRRRPMTDLLGPAGLYYTLGDSADLADRLVTALTMDRAALARRRESTSARVAERSWRRAATETVDQLELALRGR